MSASTNTFSLLVNLFVNSTTISPTVLSYLSGLSSNAQSQFNTLTTNMSTNTTNIATNTSNISSLQTTTGISCSSGITTIGNKKQSGYIDMSGNYFYGGNSQTLPSSTSGSIPGMSILWNTDSGSGRSNLLNYSQGIKIFSLMPDFTSTQLATH